MSNILWVSIFWSLLLPFFSFGIETLFWEETSKNDFEKGEVETLVIGKQGELFLAPEVEFQVDTGELYIWSLVENSKGELFLGTGNRGKIFKVKGNSLELFFDSPEEEIFALAIDDKDRLYIGGSPDGIIYKIDSQGHPKTIFTSGETYIWSLLVDRRDYLWVGTGSRGRIYQLTLAGQVKKEYQTAATHITHLCEGKNGDIFAASIGQGLLYRISPKGELSVVYDFEEEELQVLAFDPQGFLYVGANKGRRVEPRVVEEKEKDERQPKKEIRYIVGKSAVYKITPSGSVEKLWELKKGYVYSLLFDKRRNELLVGTSIAGKIYALDQRGEANLISGGEKILELLNLFQSKGGTIYLASGNPGLLHQLRDGFNKEGVFTSQVFDTQTQALWGKISWEAELPLGTKLEVQTRVGFSNIPDHTWSAWSRVYKKAEGEDIVHPRARFIQYKVKFRSNSKKRTPRLKAIRIAYLPQNVRPKIFKLRVEKKLKDVSSEEASGGELKISWKTEDENKDKLSYQLFFKKKGETRWKLLEKDLKETSYTLPQKRLPDGEYLIKLVASDELTNPPEEALQDTLVSEVFKIDTTPPEIRKFQVKENIATFIVEDKVSIVKKVEYSWDAKRWYWIFPNDRVLDSKMEKFTLSLRRREANEQTLLIRAQDESGNIGGLTQTIRR
jgi:hypothetical protein